VQSPQLQFCQPKGHQVSVLHEDLLRPVASGTISHQVRFPFIVLEKQAQPVNNIGTGRVAL